MVAAVPIMVPAVVPTVVEAPAAVVPAVRVAEANQSLRNQAASLRTRARELRRVAAEQNRSCAARTRALVRTDADTFGRVLKN